MGLPYLFLLKMEGNAPNGANLVMPSAWEGLLGSLGAGVREEVWLRLGCMTFIAWLGSLLTGQRPVGVGVAWTANLLAALIFGAIHLPQANLLLGLTPGVVAVVFLGNGLPGLMFGWLYWRKGLLAAMMAHTCFDIVLKVIPPAFGLG
jgi:membrane protease YdiL (CAAX protease family)